MSPTPYTLFAPSRLSGPAAVRVDKEMNVANVRVICIVLNNTIAVRKEISLESLTQSGALWKRIFGRLSWGYWEIGGTIKGKTCRC
jgi:hypothetical protein